MSPTCPMSTGAEESAAPMAHKEKVLKAQSLDTLRSLVLSGRPLRLIPNDWVRSWEEAPEKIRDFCERGVIPLETWGKHIGARCVYRPHKHL